MEMPIPASRERTFHQSLGVISPTARARITRVELCAPELPPVAMMSGMKTTSPARLAMVASCCSITVAVRSWPPKRITSQTARFQMNSTSPVWK